MYCEPAPKFLLEKVTACLLQKKKKQSVEEEEERKRNMTTSQFEYKLHHRQLTASYKRHMVTVTALERDLSSHTKRILPLCVSNNCSHLLVDIHFLQIPKIPIQKS